jgi:hypothetical protein
MFLFDWQKVYDEAKGNVSRCNMIMKMLINKSIPTNVYDPIYKYHGKDFVGDNFMLHPDILLHYSYKYTDREIAIYFALSSLRSLAEFIVSQKTTLDLIHCPVGLELIIDNRLLTIKDGSIHFLYEEVTPENTH